MTPISRKSGFIARMEMVGMDILDTVCDVCHLWHIDSDIDPVAQCHHCDRPLCPQYDYACISCGRLVCDRELQACQADDCDIITCNDCVDLHLSSVHPQEAAA